MTTLTPEHRQEIQRAGEEPVRFADPEPQTEYVILRADVYDCIRALADDTRANYPLAMRKALSPSFLVGQPGAPGH
jgi:hypothetical protein